MSYRENYVYAEVDQGVLTVVEDLDEADYAYTENVDYRFEMREAGRRVQVFDSWSEVEEFLG